MLFGYHRLTIGFWMVASHKERPEESPKTVCWFLKVGFAARYERDINVTWYNRCTSVYPMLWPSCWFQLHPFPWISINSSVPPSDLLYQCSKGPSSWHWENRWRATWTSKCRRFWSAEVGFLWGNIAGKIGRSVGWLKGTKGNMLTGNAGNHGLSSWNIGVFGFNFT